MWRIIAALVAGVALVAGIPVLGGASDDLPAPTDEAYRVPADMVEHTVTQQVVVGGHEPPRRTRSELWLAGDRGREIVTDADTGAVIAETTAVDGEIRVREPGQKRTTVERQARLPFASAAYEAAAQRDGLRSGRLRTVEQRGGRLVLRSSEGTITVVDARTFELLERRTTLPGAVQTETRTTELLPKAEVVWTR